MSGYIGVTPVPQATQTRDTFTATAGQTVFATNGYTPGFLDVFLNGVHLVNITDFTATNGSDVILTSGAADGDNVEVLSFGTFQSGDFVPTSGGTFSGSVEFPSITATTADINGGNIDGTTIGAITPAPVNGTTGMFTGNVDVSKTAPSLKLDYPTIGAFSLSVVSSDALVFQGGPAERMRIDSAGNVGIGVVPTELLHVAGNIRSTGQFLANSGDSATAPGLSWNTDDNTGFFQKASNTIGIAVGGSEVGFLDSSGLEVDTGANSSVPLRLKSSTTTSSIDFVSDGRPNSQVRVGSNGPDLWFVSGGLERMRVKTNGDLVFNKTNSNFSGAGMYLTSSGQMGVTRELGAASGSGVLLLRRAESGNVINFYNGTTQTGSIAIGATTTTYNTSSRRSEKENITDYDANPGEKIDAMLPRGYNWKADGKRAIGFIADEFGDVFPDSTTYDEDGIAVAIDAGTPEVIATLVAEIKSLRKRLEALEGANT